MQDIPIRNTIEEQDYQAGFAKVMWFAERAKTQGWKFSDRQLVHEIIQRERAARIREKSSLPIAHSKAHSAAWNRGQADALRALLRTQRERYGN
ncbi:MAG TPA: hypothetical protein VFU49_06970 [Ktedonobacteraceae bacterium]|nr:hypothetical protein [Ktedonobacteraceae bacterium]